MSACSPASPTATSPVNPRFIVQNIPGGDQLKGLHAGMRAKPDGLTARVFGKVSRTTSLAVGGTFLAAIVGVYDHLLHANWHEPLILQLWDRLSAGGSS